MRLTPCMMPPMTDWNFLTLLIVAILFLLWKLELVATLLNLKTFPEKIPQELASVMDESKLERGRDYLRVNSKHNLLQSAVSLTALLIFWFAGGFAWLDAFARSVTNSELTAGLVFLAAFFLGQSLLSLPFSIYETFVIENHFGFNRSTPATFIADHLKGLVLAALIGLPLAAAVLWIFNRVPNAWLWAWILLTIAQLLLTWLAPTYIMPLFNKFTPMPEGELKSEIENLGNR
ncbi:MAG: M48 family peptidase, partial [Luteolibacter sp.]